MNDRLSGKRLVIIENPTGKSAQVQREVFDRLDHRDLAYERFTTKSSDAEINISAIAEYMRDGDIICSAAGDGTASQTANAALVSGVDVELGFLPFGNFNDMAYTHTSVGNNILDLLEASTVDVTPLSIDIDGKLWRYSPAYTTIGWSAIAASGFYDNLSRTITKKAPPALKLGYSLLQIMDNYFRNRNDYLADFHTSTDSQLHHEITDILAVNGPRIGGSIGPDRNYYDSSEFGYRELDVSRFFANVPFGLRSLAHQMPLQHLEHIDIAFEETVDLPIQTEGEFVRKTANRISIYKDPRQVINILHTRK